MSTINAKIRILSNTTANWTSLNPTLESGRIAFDTDTGKIKIGTGSTDYANLPFAALLPSEVRRSVSVFVQDKPTDGEILWRDVATSGTTFTIAANSTECTANATTAATANTSIYLEKNGAVVGSLDWTANATTAAVNLPAAVSFAAGDLRALVANATADATLANVSITLTGEVY